MKPYSILLQRNGTYFMNKPHIYTYCIYRFVDQSFIYSPTDALVSCLKKNNIETDIKIAPTYFGVTITPSSEGTLIRAY